jgi:uncharacterized protein RhaS with RHS repeats
MACLVDRYDANHRLTHWGGQAYSYDANGNLLSDGQRSYTWNARNELSSLSPIGASTVPPIPPPTSNTTRWADVSAIA